MGEFIPSGSDYAKTMELALNLTPQQKVAFVAGMKAAACYLTDHEGKFRPSLKEMMQRLSVEINQEAGKFIRL